MPFYYITLSVLLLSITWQLYQVPEQILNYFFIIFLLQIRMLSLCQLFNSVFVAGKELWTIQNKWA